MTDPDETQRAAFNSPPPWWSPVLESGDSGGAAALRGHAFLVMSEDGHEASLFATFLAARHLCQQSDSVAPCGECSSCRAFLQGAHGDFLRVCRQEGKTAIGIEQIRDATRFVQQTALYGLSKVLLIDAAERMTLAAANSLLKTLEEPAGSTLVLLASSGAWRLPATVRSRCQRFMLPRPSPDEAIAWLAEQIDCDTQEATERLGFACGMPIAASVASDATDVSVLAELSRSFDDISAQQSVPASWSNVPLELLLDRLMVWVESQARGQFAENQLIDGASWLSLHRCIAEVSGRVKLGATPSQEILMTEVYRLCRSRGHRAFDEVADRFLTGLGRVGLAS